MWNFVFLGYCVQPKATKLEKYLSQCISGNVVMARCVVRTVVCTLGHLIAFFDELQMLRLWYDRFAVKG